MATVDGVEPLVVSSCSQGPPAPVLAVAFQASELPPVCPTVSICAAGLPPTAVLKLRLDGATVSEPGGFTATLRAGVLAGGLESSVAASEAVPVWGNDTSKVQDEPQALVAGGETVAPAPDALRVTMPL